MTQRVRSATSFLTDLSRASVVFVIAVCAATGTYLWQSRATTLQSGQTELHTQTASAMEHLNEIVSASTIWGQALQRFHTFHALQPPGSRDAQLAGHILDIVDQNPALAGLLILDGTGIIHFASDGSPGRFPYAAVLPIPSDMDTAPLYGAVASPSRLPFILDASFQIWRPAYVGGNSYYYVFFIADAAMREVLHASEETGYVTTALVRGADPRTTTKPGFEEMVETHAFLAGHNTIEGRIDQARRLDDLWRPKALFGAASIGALMLLTAMLFILKSTYRQRTERAEIDAEKWNTWLGTLLSAASDAILVVAEDQRILVANDAAHAVFGWEPGTLNGIALENLVPREIHGPHRDHTHSFFKGGQSLVRMGDYRRVRGVRRDGAEFPIMVSLGYARIGEFRYAVAIARDMTAVEDINRQLTSMSLELSSKLEEAQAASAAKLRFLATMSHELRTPLNAIIGFSDILQTDAFGLGLHETYGGYARDINQSGVYLLKLINDILEISKHGSGKVSLFPEPCTVGDVLDLPVRNLSLIGKNTNIDVHVAVSSPPEVLFLDIRAMRQCIFNILGNAIKYSPPFSTVKMDVTFDETTMHIRITDRGRGIPEDDLPRITRPFERGGDPYVSQPDGVGLGLAITEDLLELMGGSLQITSKVGEGTTVLISVPTHTTDLPGGMLPAAGDRTARVTGGSAP